MSTILRWTVSKWRCRCLCSTFQPGRRSYSKSVSDTAVLPKPRLNYNAISESIVYKSHNAFNRKYPLPVGALQSIARTHAEQKELSSQLSMKRHLRSTMGDRIRMIKDPTEKQFLLGEAKTLKTEITQLEENLAVAEETLLNLALQLPNDTHPDAPIGPEDAATVLSTHGPPLMPASADRDHTEVGRALALFDFESAAVVTGSSWYYLQGEAALLESALTNYAISIALKHGFKFVTTPDVVREDIASRCGFQPRDQQSGSSASQTYFIADSHPELVLSGTAEIPLAGMFANKIFPENTLPMKVVGLGRAFRAEAGSRGADTRGLYRVHQFTKVELFAVCEDDDSERIMEEFRRVQTEIFEGLGIPFRVLDMPTEELGASAFRKYDMEAWMPGRGRWGEISSTSNCTDYQARRLHIRYRRPAAPQASANGPSTHGSSQSATAFAHTLNGTAAAIPRLILTLVENGARFNEEGKVIGLDLPVLFRCVLRDTFDLLMAACNKPFGTLGTGGLGVFNIAEINRGPELIKIVVCRADVLYKWNEVPNLLPHYSSNGPPCSVEDRRRSEIEPWPSSATPRNHILRNGKDAKRHWVKSNERLCAEYRRFKG